jgi:hypothetical protein
MYRIGSRGSASVSLSLFGRYGGLRPEPDDLFFVPAFDKFDMPIIPYIRVPMTLREIIKPYMIDRCWWAAPP